MHFTTVSLALLIGTIVLAIAGSSDADGLKCWMCISTLDKKCHDDNFSGTESETMKKIDCSEVPWQREINGQPIPREAPATFCTKTVLTVGDTVTFTGRSCASPGEPGITRATLPQCKTNKNDKGSATACICEGDYCNGSETLKLATVFTFLPLGLLFLVNRF